MFTVLRSTLQTSCTDEIRRAKQSPTADLLDTLQVEVQIALVLNNGNKPVRSVTSASISAIVSHEKWVSTS